ncbi:WD repeat-containing protein 64 [Paramecium bursaria]
MQNHVGLQLFFQPSLTACYLKNNKSMTAYDFTLIFPNVPLIFGISSDIAAAWSKLIYEQVLMNKTQQRLEVEILGPTEKEAYILEECVKLLFGFKIEICAADVWIALKISDTLGLTQSPQVEDVTVQETLLQFAKDNLDSLNLIEGWDYVIQVIESGGEGLLVHRNEIKQLATDIHNRIKEYFINSKFEILTQYGHNLELNDVRFQLKDLKREHYIQLRSLFYQYVNQQESLSSNQNLVKILFDELDPQYELDGYINKYFETVGSKLEGIDNVLQEQKKSFTTQLDKLSQKLTQDIDSLKRENQTLKNQLFYAHQRITAFKTKIIRFYLNDDIQVYENGTIVIQNNGTISTENIGDLQITATHYQLDFSKAKQNNIILIPCQEEESLKYDQDVSVIHIQQLGYEKSLIIWWNQKQIFKENTQFTINVIYSHFNFGNFVLTGDKGGNIQFLYLNEAKQQMNADHIKSMKNTSIPIKILRYGIQIDQLLALQEQDVTIWNWEMEHVQSVVKLEQSILDIAIIQDKYRFLSTNGYVSEYNGQQLMESIYVQKNPICLYQDDYVICKNGSKLKLEQGPVCVSNHHVRLQSVISHHQETCVYGLQLINYPYCVSSSDDKQIVIFNLRSKETTILKGHQAYVRAISLLQGGKQLISGSYDTTIKIWDINLGNMLKYINWPQQTNIMYFCIESYINYVCWNWKTATCVWKVDQGKNEIWSLLHIHQLALSGNKDGTIRIINTGQDGLKSQTQQELKVHKSYVNCMLHIQQNIIASGSSDNRIQIVDIKVGQIIQTLIGHQNIVWSLQNIDDNVIVSGSTEGKIKIWNWRQGLCLNSQVVCIGSIYVLLKIPNTRKLLGGTANGEILFKYITDTETYVIYKYPQVGQREVYMPEEFQTMSISQQIRYRKWKSLQFLVWSYFNPMNNARDQRIMQSRLVDLNAHILFSFVVGFVSRKFFRRMKTPFLDYYLEDVLISFRTIKNTLPYIIGLLFHNHIYLI